MRGDFQKFQSENGMGKEEAFERLMGEYERIAELGNSFKLVVYAAAVSISLEKELKNEWLYEEFAELLQKM